MVSVRALTQTALTSDCLLGNEHVRVGRGVMQKPASTISAKSAFARPFPGKTVATAAAKPASNPEWDLIEQLPMRRVGMFFLLGFLFLRVTALHELLATKIGLNTRILYLFGPPAILFMFLSGGFQRALRYRPPRLWLGLLICLYLSSVFSYWRSDSLSLAWSYTRAEIMTLVLIAGLAYTMKDFWRIMMTLAAAGFVNIVLSIIFVAETAGDRMRRDFGTMGNANDFAAHLIYILPFIGLVLFTRRSIVIRLAAGGMCLIGLYRILSTGSRGAFVALLVTFAFTFWRASIRQKVFLSMGTALMGMLLLALLPSTVATRLKTVFMSAEEEMMATGSEAYESRMSRAHLLKRSIYLTLTHPLLGVGPGQFMYVENEDAKEQTGKKGSWHVTHNAYTQISSEMGIPAAILYLGALWTTFLMLNRVHRLAVRQPPSVTWDRIAISSYCILVSMVGFGTACFFLSLGYAYHFPLITGLTVVLYHIAERESQREEWRKANAAAAQPALPKPPVLQQLRQPFNRAR
ncbi:MAG: O-antigen ligase family protein [Bryobacterales bacterium]|nr:O-antigen ligase family protein [Bryobacterales bacterium]